MEKELKEKIRFGILEVLRLLFLPIAAPIMWVSDKIRFRNKIELEDAFEAFGFYVLLCSFWAAGVFSLIVGCMVKPLIVLWIASIIFVFVGIPYLLYFGINEVIDYKNKKSEKYFINFEYKSKLK